MTRTKTLLGLTLLLGALLISAAPAFAEFESKNGSSNQGKGEIYEATLEGGGARVSCQAEEGVSKAEWTVENSEGKAQKKGPDLQVNVAGWGECQTKASGLKAVATKISACEMAVKQATEETTVPLKIVKACTITVSSCEIKIGSQEPKGTELETTGSNAENTRLTAAVSGMVWEVSSGCAALGVAASKAVSFTGSAGLSSVEENTLAYTPKEGKYLDPQAKLVLFGEKETETLGNVTCEETILTPGKGRSTTLLVTPELLKCKATLGKEALKAVKSLNECKAGLQLQQPERFEEEEEGPGLYRSKVALLKECKVALEIGSCIIKIAGEGEALQWAYYNSLKELTLEEPETTFTVGGVKYTTSEGCKAVGLPAAGGKAKLQVGRPVGFVSPGNVYNFTPALKNVEGGMEAHKQEFIFKQSPAAAIRCEGVVEYTNNAMIARSVDRLNLTPTFNECKLAAGGNEEVVTTIQSTNCTLMLAGLTAAHTGDLSLKNTSPRRCAGIGFFTARCGVTLQTASAKRTVNYTTRVGGTESEVNFAVTRLPWVAGRLNAGCIFPQEVSGYAEYDGKTFLEKLILQP
jgi:hypothetical protein